MTCYGATVETHINFLYEQCPSTQFGDRSAAAPRDVAVVRMISAERKRFVDEPFVDTLLGEDAEETDALSIVDLYILWSLHKLCKYTQVVMIYLLVNDSDS